MSHLPFCRASEALPIGTWLNSKKVENFQEIKSQKVKGQFLTFFEGMFEGFPISIYLIRPEVDR